GTGAAGAAGPSGPRRGSGSEGRRGRDVAGPADGGGDLVDGGHCGVVLDLDPARGELDADAPHAPQAADLLLDLGDAGGAAEALGAEERAGDGGGGGGHEWLPSGAGVSRVSPSTWPQPRRGLVAAT